MPPPEIPGFVANEAYCMGLAREIEYRLDRIRGRHLDRLGDDLAVAGRRVRGHANEIAERALNSREAARERLLPP